jgi:hypothetical protein
MNSIIHDLLLNDITYELGFVKVLVFRISTLPDSIMK